MEERIAWKVRKGEELEEMMRKRFVVVEMKLKSLTSWNPLEFY
jgi:hypothetical protein